MRQRPQHTNTFGDPFLLDTVHNDLDRLVGLGRFLDEGLWVGANDTWVQRAGSKVWRGVTWVWVGPENVGVARVEVARFVGKQMSYRIHWFSVWWS